MNSSIINTRYLLAFGETGKIKFENGIENNEMYDNWKKNTMPLVINMMGGKKYTIFKQ